MVRVVTAEEHCHVCFFMQCISWTQLDFLLLGLHGMYDMPPAADQDEISDACESTAYDIYDVISPISGVLSPPHRAHTQLH